VEPNRTLDSSPLPGNGDFGMYASARGLVFESMHQTGLVLSKSSTPV
jgi:hypothetical protein